MPILDRSALAHLGVRREGTVQPLCGAWRSTWNYALAAAEATCPQCRAAIALAEAEAVASPPKP
jgi:hypothetical protein